MPRGCSSFTPKSRRKPGFASRSLFTLITLCLPHICILTRPFLSSYASKLLYCTLPPIYDNGISLEAHSQNILARFDISSKTLVGFAYRDFGGLKLHTPTLLQHGYEVKSSPPGSLIFTDSMQELWENCHHTLFQSHLNQLIQALGLQQSSAWAIVRQLLEEKLDHEQGKPLFDYLTQDMVPYKCFMRMKMQGLYRDVRNLALYPFELVLMLSSTSIVTFQMSSYDDTDCISHESGCFTPTRSVSWRIIGWFRSLIDLSSLRSRSRMNSLVP